METGALESPQNGVALSMASFSDLVAMGVHSTARIAVSSRFVTILGELFYRIVDIFKKGVEDVLKGYFTKLILQSNGSMVIGVSPSFSRLLDQD